MPILPGNRNTTVLSEVSGLRPFVLLTRERNIKVKMSMEYWWNKTVKGEQREIGEKPAPMSFCPPRSLKGLKMDRTLASAERCQRLKTVARLNYKLNLSSYLTVNGVRLEDCFFLDMLLRHRAISPRSFDET
jgi:hypothetical protein